eukprot:Tbor_TRINITY_DN5042_c0_g2::TRINITY_DN5042_c0_g2_i1::g.14403::m.14403/K00111/glpA, glpD; glycerol-3-phosphate dehydrogenase
MSTARRMIAGVGAAGVGALTAYACTPSTYGRRTFMSCQNPILPQPIFMESPPTRQHCLTQLLEAKNPNTPLDVLIIGGGATGTGIALDLASRAVQPKTISDSGEKNPSPPLKVGLIESNDYASETSSRSSKLIHGGMRYLEKAVFGLDIQQLKLVFEAMKERSIMINQAPFMAEPLATAIPCYGMFDVVMYWSGVKFYDFLAVVGNGVIGEFSYYRSVADQFNKFPILKDKAEKKGLIGSVVYYDGTHNDARVCLLAGLTAACFGAATVNYCRLSGLEMCLSDGSVMNDVNKKSKEVTTNDKGHTIQKDHPLVKATFVDRLTGAEHIIYAKTIVNATGPFGDIIRSLQNKGYKGHIVPSSGTHIVLPGKYSPEGEAVIAPSPDGRVLFMINWQGHCVAGTTDNPCKVCEAPNPTEADVEFILESMKPYCGTIKREEVLSTWCGIRPLAIPEDDTGDKETNNIVREHSIVCDKEKRMLSISGGKWTTYRKMAEDTVNALIENELVDPKKLLHNRSTNSMTSDLVLHGGRDYKRNSVNLHVAANVPSDALEYWQRSYGDQYEKVFNIAVEKSENNANIVKKGLSPANKIFISESANEINNKQDNKISGGASPILSWETNLRRIAPSFPITDADIRYSVRYEHCVTVQDFLARRSRIAFLNVKEAKEYALPVVAEVMGEELGWDKKKKAEEVEDALKYMKTFMTAEMAAR